MFDQLVRVNIYWDGSEGDVYLRTFSDGSQAYVDYTFDSWGNFTGAGYL
jgi:hypothetical protein